MRFASRAPGSTRPTKSPGWHARAAIASGTDDATALAIAAFAISILSKDHATALSAVDRALSLNASSAVAHYLGALIHA